MEGGRLDKIVAGSGGWNPDTQLFTNMLQKLSYSYDDVGNVTQIEQIIKFDPLETETQLFEYDEINRLKKWTMGQTIENYDYDTSTGNLNKKANIDLTYNAQVTCPAGNRTIPHAVSAMSANTYSYDCNGNQSIRHVGGQNYQLGYDAENRLISVTGVDGTTFSAQFTYNADGQRVKSTINGETIYFVGGYYEKKGSEITKYYISGASRIAVRKYLTPQYDTLNYILGDHLGSTSITVDADTGNKVETRYKPWGEVRFTTEDLTEPIEEITLPTRYTFTGQYSHISDEATDLGAAGFGLMFYNARWYDPVLGRMAQADSIVPGGVQGLDRFAYVGNNPVRYTDPSGHRCSPADECKSPSGDITGSHHPLLEFENDLAT